MNDLTISYERNWFFSKLIIVKGCTDSYGVA